LGTQDWPTKLNLFQNSVKDLISELKKGSDFITKGEVENASEVKLHRGFAKYLFADVVEKSEFPLLYRRYWSKFDKIVYALKAIYDDPKHADYQLCISVSSWGQWIGIVEHSRSLEMKTCSLSTLSLFTLLAILSFNHVNLYEKCHSLGGALAQLMSFVVGCSEKCREILPPGMPILAVTYASPCVGNEAFSKAMFELQEQNITHHLRFTNEGDLVPVFFSFDEYTQSGCNFHLREGQLMELGGFGNTQTFWSELNLDAEERHSMFSHQKHLFYKVDGKNHVNAKIWKRYLEDIFFVR
jgi:hypothetical protein